MNIDFRPWNSVCDCDSWLAGFGTSVHADDRTKKQFMERGL